MPLGAAARLLGVILIPTFQRSMARLALLAVLLLALVPTIGRVMEQRSDQIGPYWAAICTMTGLKYVDLSVNDGDKAGVPAPIKGHSDPDCAYCPLLASIVVLALWWALGFPHLARPACVAARAAPARKALYPCGLGSRGPPLFL